MYDCAVIGTGPAGLSAVINLKLYNKNYIWFGSREMFTKAVGEGNVAAHGVIKYLSERDKDN